MRKSTGDQRRHALQIARRRRSSPNRAIPPGTRDKSSPTLNRTAPVPSSPPRVPRSGGRPPSPSSSSGRPPLVSPPTLLQSRSWEEEQSRFALTLSPRVSDNLSSDRSVFSEVGGYTGSSGVFVDERSVVSDSNIDAVPMDEEEEYLVERHSKSNPKAQQHPVSGIDWSPTRRFSHDPDDISSLGGVEDSLAKVTNALNSGKRSAPSHATQEERAFWDAVQVVLSQAKHDVQLDKASDSDFYQEKYHAKQAELEKLQKDHDQSLRAIQRVLVDVTTQRDDALEVLHTGDNNTAATVSSGSSNGSESPPPPQNSWLVEKVNYRKELEINSRKISDLEKKLKIAKADKTRGLARSPGGSFSGNDSMKLQAVVADLKKQVESLSAENASLRRHLQDENPNGVADSGTTKTPSSGHLALLEDEVAEKTAQLESVKMIMSSLEKANSDMSAEHRNKLKSKDDRIAQLKLDLGDRQKRLDRLAKELKHTQVAYAKREKDGSVERERRRAASVELERNLADIRAATVVLEAGQDPSSINSISNVLVNVIETLKGSIDSMDEDGDDGLDGRSVSSARSLSSWSSSRADGPHRDNRADLEEKTAALKRVEEELRKQKEECHLLKTENERRQQARDDEILRLHTEMHQLREHCQTNMEVLTRKERELTVLRDSLKVDDEEVGYISDDATEFDEDEDLPPPSQVGTSTYGPSQAEALATLSSYGSGSFDAGPTFAANSNEIVVLRNELLQAKSEHDKSMKELKTEKESLANAKMIISSLEKANKSMMEDLRSRLQDSNSAITSLLEKSIESDKTTAMLRRELEKVRGDFELEKSKSGMRQPPEERIFRLASQPAETID